MCRVATSDLPPALAIFVEAAWLTQLLEIWRTQSKGLFDSYRPELHYMCGPGLKWPQKHAHLLKRAGPTHRLPFRERR